MAYDTDAADGSRLRSAFAPGELDRVDQILLGACAAIWLVALGAGVAAAVALVDLGRGRPESSGESATPWLLYTVIAVSAAVIIAAVPLLLRARRTAQQHVQTPARPAVPAAQPEPPVLGAEAPTQKLRVLGTAEEPVNPPPHPPIPAAAPMTAVDQLWLRCALVIACAIGVAMVAIGVGTYLMAVDRTVAAWVCFALAGLITLAMPVAPWFYLRELRVLADDAAPA